MPEEFNNQKILENNKLIRFILLILLPTFIVLITLGYFYSLGRYITTENAYIKAPIISVQSQASGRIEKVFVKETDNKIRSQMISNFFLKSKLSQKDKNNILKNAMMNQGLSTEDRKEISLHLSKLKRMELKK